MSTPDKDRKAKEREEKRAAGFLPHEVWVHKRDWPYVKGVIAALYQKRKGKRAQS